MRLRVARQAGVLFKKNGELCFVHKQSSNDQEIKKEDKERGVLDKSGGV